MQDNESVVCADKSVRSDGLVVLVCHPSRSQVRAAVRASLIG